MTRFRLRAKIFFLTFSQIGEDVIEELRSTPTQHFRFIEEVLGTPSDYRLARESHQDGASHLHCVVGYAETQLVNSASLFDYRGAHPNIKSIRGTIKKPWNYAGKDGDIIHELGGPNGGDSGTGGSIAERWSHAIDAPTEDEFFEEMIDTTLMREMEIQLQNTEPNNSNNLHNEELEECEEFEC